MTIATKLKDALTSRRRAAREQTLAALSKSRPTKADLAALPDWLVAAELTADQAERLADLQREAENLRVVISTRDARLAAVERAVGALAEHRAETRAIADKRQALEQQLDRELAEARERHRQARVAEARLAEVEAEVEGITELAGPLDLAEADPVFINGQGGRDVLPGILRLADAPVRAVTFEQFHAELQRRQAVVRTYAAKTKDERSAAFAKAHTAWFKRADRQYRDHRQAVQVAQSQGRPLPTPKPYTDPAPTPHTTTYSDAVAAGQHKGTPDAA